MKCGWGSELLWMKRWRAMTGNRPWASEFCTHPRGMCGPRGYRFSPVRGSHRTESAPLIGKIASLLLAKGWGVNEPHKPIKFWLQLEPSKSFPEEGAVEMREFWKVVGRNLNLGRLACQKLHLYQRERTRCQILKSKILASFRQWWRAPKSWLTPWWRRPESAKKFKLSWWKRS